MTRATLWVRLGPVVLVTSATACAPVGEGSGLVDLCQGMRATTVVLDEVDTQARELHDDDSAPLWPAQQGGFIVPFGHRIVGAGPGKATVSARLSREGDMAPILELEAVTATSSVDESVVQTDQRTVSHFLHLRLCPGYLDVATTQLSYHLESEIFVEEGCSLTTSVRFVPTCSALDGEALERCLCECGADFGPGSCD